MGTIVLKKGSLWEVHAEKIVWGIRPKGGNRVLRKCTSRRKNDNGGEETKRTARGEKTTSRKGNVRKPRREETGTSVSKRSNPQRVLRPGMREG